MASATTIRLESLLLSASELKAKTDWDDTIIREWLNFVRNLLLLAEEIDTKNDIIKNTTVVNASPYSILSTDEDIFFNTDAAPIIALLPAGIDGTNHRMINVGTSKNDVILTPNGTDELFGENETERIADSEVLIATFETTEGWY